MPADTQSLFSILDESIAKYDKEKIQRAFDYAEQAHRGQFRKSGEEYIYHPLSVAEICAELNLDTDAICAALLHDIVEDCPGVIASITKILADREISISSLIQHENQGENVSLVILTHPAMEKEIRSAMEELSKLSVSRAAVKMLRIEEF